MQSAVDAGAISARAKPAAAAEKMRELLGSLKQRGCKEEFEADPELLQNGQVRLMIMIISCCMLQVMHLLGVHLGPRGAFTSKGLGTPLSLFGNRGLGLCYSRGFPLIPY